MNIIDVCRILGVICSVLPSAKYSLFRLVDDGITATMSSIIPSPPYHCVKTSQNAIEYGIVGLVISENPVVVIPDIDWKSESRGPSIPEK